MSLHINRPLSTRYICRLRESGRRHWTVLDGEFMEEGPALVKLAAAFQDRRWKRGQILVIADCYDPVIVASMTR